MLPAEGPFLAPFFGGLFILTAAPKTADEIRELMSGNICRCGAYPNIVAAIQQAMGQS